MAYETELRSDIDAISGSIKPITTVKSDRFQHKDFTLNEVQMLADLAGMSHYQILLRLMEGEVERGETDHMRAYKNKEEFERTGLIAVAQRIFFERVQKEIEHQRQELLGLLEEQQVSEQLKQVPLEELMKESVRQGF